MKPLAQYLWELRAGGLTKCLSSYEDWAFGSRGDCVFTLDGRSLKAVADHIRGCASGPGHSPNDKCVFTSYHKFQPAMSGDSLVVLCINYSMLGKQIDGDFFKRLMSMAESACVQKFIQSMDGCTGPRECLRIIVENSPTELEPLVEETVEMIFRARPEIAGDLIRGIVIAAISLLEQALFKDAVESIAEARPENVDGLIRDISAIAVSQQKQDSFKQFIQTACEHFENGSEAMVVMSPEATRMAVELKWLLERLEPGPRELAHHFLWSFVPEKKLGILKEWAGALMGWRRYSRLHIRDPRPPPLTPGEQRLKYLVSGLSFRLQETRTSRYSPKELKSFIDEMVSTDHSLLPLRWRLFYSGLYLKMVGEDKQLLECGIKKQIFDPVEEKWNFGPKVISDHDYTHAYAELYRSLHNFCDSRLALVRPGWMKPGEYNRVVVTLIEDLGSMPLLPDDYIIEMLSKSDTTNPGGDEIDQKAWCVCWLVADRAHSNLDSQLDPQSAFKWSDELARCIRDHGPKVPQAATRILELLKTTKYRTTSGSLQCITKNVYSSFHCVINANFKHISSWLVQALLQHKGTRSVLDGIATAFRSECSALIDFMLDNPAGYGLEHFEAIMQILCDLGLEDRAALSERLHYRTALNELAVVANKQWL